MQVVAQIAPQVGTALACRAFDLPRSTYYGRKRAAAAPPRVEVVRRPRTCIRALADEERQRVLDLLHGPRFVDKAPGEVVATLLDEGEYMCSERTMYRILASHDEVRERRNQRRHPTYTKPELCATAPNQVWSWDITKLKGPVKWVYFHLYVILDIFSRYAVGWMVATRESTELAKRLIRETCEKHGIEPGQLTIHADRGTSMKARALAEMLADLGIAKTHSRPQVSNDNPYSESQFKTLKYRPEFPGNFGSLQDARAFCGPFFDWYNNDHRHSGIGMLTPETVHYHLAEQALAMRDQVLRQAYEAHPERFVRGIPTPRALPNEAWINPPTLSALLDEESL